MVSELLMTRPVGQKIRCSGIMVTDAFCQRGLPISRLDREFPYQVSFHANYVRNNADGLLIQMFCEHRNIAPRHHTVRRGSKDFIVYCFADPQHAASFRAAFGGEPFVGAVQKTPSNSGMSAAGLSSARV